MRSWFLELKAIWSYYIAVGFHALINYVITPICLPIIGISCLHGANYIEMLTRGHDLNQVIKPPLPSIC